MIDMTGEPCLRSKDTQFSEDLQASCALVNLRIKLALPPGASTRAVVELALARIEELEGRAEMDRLYLEASRERLLDRFSSMGAVGS